jgi:hypothetical protein
VLEAKLDDRARLVAVAGGAAGLGLGLGLEARLLLVGGLRLVVVEELEELGGLVLVERLGELVHGRRHLEALHEHTALALDADVARPADEAADVAGGLWRGGGGAGKDADGVSGAAHCLPCVARPPRCIRRRRACACRSCRELLQHPVDLCHRGVGAPLHHDLCHGGVAPLAAAHPDGATDAHVARGARVERVARRRGGRGGLLRALLSLRRHVVGSVCGARRRAQVDGRAERGGSAPDDGDTRARGAGAHGGRRNACAAPGGRAGGAFESGRPHTLFRWLN